MTEKLPLITARTLSNAVDMAVQSGYGALPVQVTIEHADGRRVEYPVVGVRYSGSSGLMYINAKERKE